MDKLKRAKWTNWGQGTETSAGFSAADWPRFGSGNFASFCYCSAVVFAGTSFYEVEEYSSGVREDHHEKKKKKGGGTFNEEITRTYSLCVLKVEKWRTLIGAKNKKRRALIHPVFTFFTFRVTSNRLPVLTFGSVLFSRFQKYTIAQYWSSLFLSYPLRPHTTQRRRRRRRAPSLT